jgi:5'-3' exonuclease
MLAAPEAISNPKLRQKIVENSELLEKNIKLITLKTDVPDKPWESLDSLARRVPDWDKIRKICEDMELKSIIPELPENGGTGDLFSQAPAVSESVRRKPDRPEKFAPDLFGGN